jgi:hypothetical protein
MYTYIYTYVHTYINAYLHTCIYTCILKYIHSLTHIYVNIHTYTYIHTYINLHACIRTYMHATEHASNGRLRSDALCAGSTHRYIGLVGFDDFCVRIQSVDEVSDEQPLLLRHQVHFVHQYDVRELDLIHQQVHHRARIAVEGRHAALLQRVTALEVVQEVEAIHHSHLHTQAHKHTNTQNDRNCVETM